MDLYQLAWSGRDDQLPNEELTSELMQQYPFPVALYTHDDMQVATYPWLPHSRQACWRAASNSFRYARYIRWSDGVISRI